MKPDRTIGTWHVQFGGDDIEVALDRATQRGRGDLFVFAHGAGGHMGDRGMVALTTLLCALGVDVVRFNFPYRAKGSAHPDPMPTLTRCIAAVADSARANVGPQRVIIGGRSMGGRAASMLAANGFACDALLLLAYPLHPAGKPDKLRDAHLSAIGIPVLCFNGTRDALCRRDLMDAVVSGLSSNWRMHWLDGADHSFHVTKASGRTDADVRNEIGDATRDWLDGRWVAASSPAA